MQTKLSEIISVDFDMSGTTDRIFCICQILEKKWDTMGQSIIYL